MYQKIKVDITKPDVALYTDIVYANVLNEFRSQMIPLRFHFMRTRRKQEPFEKLPLLIWIGGGAWKTSSPAKWIPVLSFFAYHGYAVASIQYRTSTQSIWPTQIQDVKAAVRYLKVHADELGIDAGRIVIGGESAGAHLAALAALTGKTDLFIAGDWKDTSAEVQAAICWYCPGDMNQCMSMRDENIAANYIVAPENLLVNADLDRNAEKVKEISPITYVTSEAPPFLFLHGDRDFLVNASGSKSLYDKLVEAGIESDYYLLEGAGHAGVEFSQPQIQEIMLEFMNKYLGLS